MSYDTLYVTCMLKKFFALLALIPLFFFATSLWGFFISVRPQKIYSSDTPKNVGLDYEAIAFTTNDAMILRGWWIPNKNPMAKTIIPLHGYPADKGDILGATAFLAQTYNLLLFDFRGLGESDGAITTAGAQETEDLRAAIRFLEGRGIKEVGVWGFSMGGAVALMTAPETPAIKAIVSRASYARLDIMARALYPLSLAREPLVWTTRLWGLLFLRRDIKNVAPEVSARRLTIPVLLIHSKDDDVIPFSHALRLRESLSNNPRAEFLFLDHLPHGAIPLEEQQRITDFFKRYL